MKKISLYLKLILIAGVTLATVSFISVVTLNLNKIENSMIEIQNKYVVQSVNDHIGHIINDYDKFLVFLSEDKVLMKSLKKKKKGEFRKAILPYYNNYRQSDTSLWGVYVTLADGTPFFRAQPINIKKKIQKNSLSLLEKTLSTKILHSGFEITKNGYFFKIVYPVFLENDEFISAIELSFKVDDIMESMKSDLGYDIAFLFKNKASNQVKTDEYNKTKDEYVIQYVTSKLLLDQLSLLDINNSKNTIFENEEEFYKLSVFDFSDYQNSSKFASIYNITDLIQDQKETLYTILATLFLVGIITIVFVILIIDFFLKQINKREEETIKKTEELYFHSRHSTLSGLPNGRVLNEDITSLENISIIMLSVDNISIFNTTYGPLVVDLFLKECSVYLLDNMPSNGTLYHTAAHEFGIILNEPKQNQENLLPLQIKAYFEQTPVYAKDVQANISFSFGIATTSSTTNSINILSKANIALLEAKRRSRGLILTYSDSMSDFGAYTQLAKNIAILQNDLENENLTPFFQPIVESITKKIVKYEVLARIKDEKGYISPHEFMQAAQVSGLHSAITKQMIQKAFKYFESTSISFSINITKHDILEDYLLDFLIFKAQIHNIIPSSITLEILEDVAIESDDIIIQSINDIAAAGFNISIDDFGVESSNISKLSNLNVNCIKIDGSFIKDIDTNIKHLKIVESMVFMANKLGLEVVAEYVHNEEVYKIVKNLGIKYCQGYYFSEPKISI